MQAELHTRSNLTHTVGNLQERIAEHKKIKELELKIENASKNWMAIKNEKKTDEKGYDRQAPRIFGYRATRSAIYKRQTNTII